MRTSDTLSELAAAVVKAQAAMPNVPKETEGQVGNQRRKYADLATATETVRPILHAHGLAYVQGCSDGGDGKVTVTTRLLHTSGEWIEDALSMPTGQGTAQAVGSAITYARRYSLMAMLGLAPDDDDGIDASTPPATQRTRRGKNGPTEAQTKKAMACFKEAGITDRAERLEVTSAYVGRDVGSWSELTRTEAGTVIDKLEANGTHVGVGEQPELLEESF